MKNEPFQSFTTIVLITLTALLCLSDSVRASAILAWGQNDLGQCNVPAGNDFTAIAAGFGHSLTLATIPEPCTLLLLSLGGLALLKKRRV